jgi:hypothetical protein
MAATVERGPALITITVSGELTADDLFVVAYELAQLDPIAPAVPRLTDTTGAIGVRLHFTAINRFAEQRRQSTLAGPVKAAWLAGSDLTFQVGRAYAGVLNHPQITLEVFRDRDEALAWLGVGPEDLSVGNP